MKKINPGAYVEAKKLFSQPIAAQSVINDIINAMGITANYVININNDDKKGFVPMDKYIKLVNQLSETKIKIKELASKKNNENEINPKNCNISIISEEFSEFIKNNELDNNIKIFDDNKNNKINLNNSDDTNKYLEKYIDDLESKIEKIKNFIKLLIKEMNYTNNLNNILYNLMITSGFNDQEAIFIIQEKQNSK